MVPINPAKTKKRAPRGDTRPGPPVTSTAAHRLTVPTSTLIQSPVSGSLVRSPCRMKIVAAAEHSAPASARRCMVCGMIGRPILSGGAHEALDHSARHRLDDLPGPVRRFSAGSGCAGRHGDVGRSHHLGFSVARSGGDGGHHHPVHVPLRASRRAREADAGRVEHAEPRRVVEPIERRTDVRVRPAQGRQVPQRGSGDGGGREVLLRALPRRRRQASQGPSARGSDRRSRPHPLRAQGAVARLHDLLRHIGDRSRLGRAEEVRREGGRRRLQEGADRRRAVQVRQLQPGRGARARGLRGLLAQDAEPSSGSCSGACPRRPRGPPRSRRARSTSPIC